MKLITQPVSATMFWSLLLVNFRSNTREECGGIPEVSRLLGAAALVVAVKLLPPQDEYFVDVAGGELSGNGAAEVHARCTG